MSSDGSNQQKNTPSEPKDTGTLPRMRTESECSHNSEDGTANFIGKRQRTTSQQFMVSSGLTAASPPKFVSLEEIMQAANGMRDMALVHQIVVDEDFKLQKVEPEENSFHKIVKDTMHRAFWDLLREELNDDPPRYTQALVLLEDIKKGLFALLLPQHTKIRQEISEILDSDLIKQQAEKGVLDFKHYAQYVISVMSKLCAPVRDERIKELTQATDVVENFKGILETLDLMQLDMANFTLQMARPDIIACSVELEREKFAKFLSIQADGLEHTRKWLLNHLDTSQSIPANVDYDKFIRSCLKRTFWQACIDLLDWDKSKPYPETFMLDVDRLIDLQTRTHKLISIATILLVSISNVHADLQSLNSFKTSLKEHISILLQTVKNEQDLINVLPNVADQVVADVKTAQKQHSLTELSATSESNLKQQIIEIGKKEHKVHELVKQRVKDFYLDIIESATAAPQKVPSGLTALQKELIEVAGQFLRIVSHNSTVFCNYYFDIVSAALPKQVQT